MHSSFIIIFAFNLNITYNISFKYFIYVLRSELAIFQSTGVKMLAKHTQVCVCVCVCVCVREREREIERDFLNSNWFLATKLSSWHSRSNSLLAVSLLLYVNCWGTRRADRVIYELVAWHFTSVYGQVDVKSAGNNFQWGDAPWDYT